MTFASVAMIRRRRGPANEAARYRTMWEGKTEAGGHFTAVVQAQALEGTGPGAGWVRARNLNTGAITSDVEVYTVDGHGQEYTIPELAVSAGDLVEIQARPQIDSYQIYCEHAAGTVSSVALTIAVPAAIPATFGTLTLSPGSPITLGATFELSATIATGSCDLGGVMNVELEWKTPDGSNPMGGTSIGGGWYRGLGKTTAATPSTLTWDDAELVASPAGTHFVRFAATNSTGATITGDWAITVEGTASIVRGFVLSPGATSHSIDSSTVTADGAAVSGTNPSVLQPGDKALLIISAPGPSDAASITYSHPGSTIDGGNLAGSGYNPRGRLALIDYTGPTTWSVTCSSAAQVAVVALAGTAYAGAGTPSYGLSPQDPGGVANEDDSTGLFVQLTNFDGGTGTTVTTAPSGHTTVLNTGPGARQIYVAQVATATAGTYNPGAATTAATTPPGAGSEESTAVAVTVSPTVPTGGSGSTSAPTVPTFSATVTLNPSDNCAAIVAAQPPGTHYNLTAGTFNNFSDVRPKTGDHFRGQGATTILEGTGKAYCFRSGTVGASDNVTIGDMLIRNYGNSTSRQEYGAIQAFPTDVVGGSYGYARSNNWFIYGCTLATNSSNGIALSDNCTVYNCTIYGHTVTGINGDRNSGGHLIHTCTLEANALNPATGSSSNGANIKLTFQGGTASAPGRTSIVPSTAQRTPAPIVIADCISNATRSGIAGTCRIGFWFDLDVRDVLVDNCTLTGHTTSGIFFEGCNYATVQNCSLTNCDGFGAALGENFINGALACGESTNIVFDSNTITDCTNAMVNRMSNRTSDWLSSTSSDNYGYSSGPRYWLSNSATIPAASPAGQSNVWTGGNYFTNNTLVNCNKVIINEGVNGGGQTVVGSTVLSSIHFTGNDYTGSSGIQFYEVNNTSKTLVQWKALPNDRDQ